MGCFPIINNKKSEITPAVTNSFFTDKNTKDGHMSMNLPNIGNDDSVDKGNVIKQDINHKKNKSFTPIKKENFFRKKSNHEKISNKNINNNSDNLNVLYFSVSENEGDSFSQKVQNFKPQVIYIH